MEGRGSKNHATWVWSRNSNLQEWIQHDRMYDLGKGNDSCLEALQKSISTYIHSTLPCIKLRTPG